MAAERMTASHLKDIWEWDSQYLKDTVKLALSEASSEYLAYLGPGNAAEDRANYILEGVKDAATTAAHAADW